MIFTCITLVLFSKIVCSTAVRCSSAHCQGEGIVVAAGSDNVPSALSSVTAYFWDEEGQQEAPCSLPPLPDAHPRLGLTLDTVTWPGAQEEVLVACGGNGWAHSCLTLGSSMVWETARNTVEGRADHSSVVTAEGLLLLGGNPLSGTSSTPTSTELHWDGQTVGELGFSLVGESEEACAVFFPEQSLVMVVGGYHTRSNTSQYIWPLGLYLGPGASLQQPRYGHSCGWTYTKDPQGDPELVLVAVGGSDSWPEFSSTEFLSLTPGSQWRSGAGPVPEGRSDMASVNLGPELYLTGGFGEKYKHTDILRLDSMTETWEFVGRMETGRSSHGAARAPRAVQQFCAQQRKTGGQM